jgi:hypothetical protein
MSCRSCDQSCFWAVTEKGKRILINSKAVSGGNIEMRGGVAIYTKPEPNEVAFVAHFTTCPAAEAWRKGKAEAR